MVLRKLFVAVLILAGCTTFGAPPQAQTQPWPSRTVRIVVPYAAGGNSDVLARVVAQRLSEAFGQTFHRRKPRRRQWRDGRRDGRASPADGYTLIWGVLPPITIEPAMTKLHYDPIKDFAPVSVVGTNGFVLVVNKDVPPKTRDGVRRLGESADRTR